MCDLRSGEEYTIEAQQRPAGAPDDGGYPRSGVTASVIAKNRTAAYTTDDHLP